MLAQHQCPDIEIPLQAVVQGCVANAGVRHYLLRRNSFVQGARFFCAMSCRTDGPPRRIAKPLRQRGIFSRSVNPGVCNAPVVQTEELAKTVRQLKQQPKDWVDPNDHAAAISDLLRSFDLCWYLAAFTEAAAKFFPENAEQIFSHKESIKKDMGVTLGEDVDTFLFPYREWLEQQAGFSVTGHTPWDVDTAVWLGKSLLQAVPIDKLMTFVVQTCPADQAHRLFRAIRGLRSFLRRQDPTTQNRLATVGRAYADGRFSLREVADTLGVDTEDALWALQEGGFARPLERIQLSLSERSEILAMVRKDRIARNETHGEDPNPHVDSVRPVVLSTQRLEGVDARCHMI